MVEEVAGRAGVDFLSAPARALVARSRGSEGIVTLLAKPLTFMNESGQAVAELVRYYKIEPSDLLIVVDEAQLPLGSCARVRARIGGRSQRLEVGDRAPWRGVLTTARRDRARTGRLRCGERQDGRGGISPIMCSRGSTRAEEPEVDRMIQRAADAAETFITSGIAAVMNGFNGGDPATTE